MKKGIVKIDINEYDRLMEVERNLELTINKIQESNIDIIKSVIGIIELNQHLTVEIERGVTNAGYSWEHSTNHGNIVLGKGPKVIKLVLK